MPYSRHQRALMAAGFCLDCEKTELPAGKFRRCMRCRLKKSDIWPCILKQRRRDYDRRRYLQRKARGEFDNR